MSTTPIKASSLADTTAALQRAADIITEKVPGTPRVTIVIQRLNGDARRKSEKYGHTTVRKVWTDTATGTDSYEVALAAEYINRPTAEVFGTLLHEMAHAYNLANGIVDCDTNGRHNKKFKETAEEKFGLIITEARAIGWSATECPDSTVKKFAGAFTHTVKSQRFKAAAPGTGSAAPKGRNRNLPIATCGCGNKVRAAASVLAIGITCNGCGEEYTTA